MPEYKVVFLPGHITTSINERETVLDAAVKTGISIKSSCGYLKINRIEQERDHLGGASFFFWRNHYKIVFLPPLYG